MKKYDISDNFRNRTHTIRVKFQWQEYKGYISYKVYGNCRGLNVMNLDFDCWDIEDIEGLEENTCALTWIEEEELWQLNLKDDEGNECPILAEPREINDYVVAIEIIDCKLTEK